MILRSKHFIRKPHDLNHLRGKKGPNSFYESVENRKACCYIRKVEPLKRALQGNKIWITGLRAEHSPDRQSLTVIEWDERIRL